MTFLIRTFRQMYHFKTLVMEKTPTAELAKRLCQSGSNFGKTAGSVWQHCKRIDLLRQADEDIRVENLPAGEISAFNHGTAGDRFMQTGAS